MEKMHAIVEYDAKDFRYEEVEKPIPGPGDVLLKIEATGVCAADRYRYFGGDPWTEKERAGRKDWKRPVVIRGHEYAGRVVEMGEGAAEATGLNIGDLATAEIHIPCRRCHYCLSGLYYLCANPRWLYNAFAEYINCPEGAILWKIPESIPAREAALIEPLACGSHGVKRARIGPHDTVVVGGLGPIGMSMLQSARLNNPYRLIGLDLNDNLCKVALELGADFAFNPETTNIDEAIMDLTDGLGCSVYLEASGSNASLETAFQLLRKQGRLMVFGVYHGKASLDFTEVGEFKELEIIGGHLGAWEYPVVIQRLEKGLLNARIMITDVFPMERFKEAFEIKNQPGHSSIKSLLIP